MGIISRGFSGTCPGGSFTSAEVTEQTQFLACQSSCAEY
jgi:hypothetical protein